MVQDFSGALLTDSASGKVVDGNCLPLEGVTIPDGLGHTPVTSGQGEYELGSLPAGLYTLAAFKAGYTSTTPGPLNVESNVTDADFVGTPES